MSTTPYVLFSDTTFVQFKKELDDKFSNLEKAIKQSDSSGLLARFETLKKETETVMNKFAEDSQKLQDSLKALATAQEETIKNYNILKDEVRSLGGKILERQNPAPVQEVKHDMGLSMFDLFED